MADQAFTKGLFFGVIAEQMIFPYPEPIASETLRVRPLLDGVTKSVAPLVDSRAIDHASCIPEEVGRAMQAASLYGLTIPAEYGGQGLSATGTARVLEEVSQLDASLGLALLGHVTLGCHGISAFGSEAQKKLFLPQIASGASIAAFALMEPGAGSDAAGIQTHAAETAEGFVLSGEKAWVTNGDVAKVMTVFARTSPREEGHKPKLSAFIVERGPGVSAGVGAPKLGLRGAATPPVSFLNVAVPRDHLIGESGRGFRVAVEVLNAGRLQLAAGCVGVCKRLVRLAAVRCQERRAFGRRIGEFGLIKDKVASMIADTFALESAVYLASGLADSKGLDFSVESAIVKVMGSDMVFRIANDVLQISGGTGYSCAQDYERYVRDARAYSVLLGTNEILRCFIALSGIEGPSRELSQVSRALREPIKGFGLLGDFALRRAKAAFGRERLTRQHPYLNREAVLFEEYVGELARGVEKILKRHEQNIVEMQFSQKRTADIAIDLFAIAACMARTSRAIERRGEEGARREIDLTTVFVQSAEKRLAANIAAFDKNDDELRKAVAAKAYTDGGYPFDILE